MAQHTFIVSDESTNSYNFIVKTAGIDTAQFERNPVMFYMHDREKGVVGRWENVRKEGVQLLMDAVFDESTELGRQVKAQVEGGFLRSASIGIDAVETKEIKGVQTVVKCRLKEVSIVDIPSNGNAVKLYKQDGTQVFTLADLQSNTAESLKAAILALLKLPATTTDAEIIEAIKTLQSGGETASLCVARAVQVGLIDENQAPHFLAMAAANLPAFRNFLDEKQRAQRSEIRAELLKAQRVGKFHILERTLFEQLAEVAGATLTRRVLACMPGRVSLREKIDHAKGTSRAGWGLDEYRKYAPEELQDNPQLYISLMEQAGQQVELCPETLEYYRRNHPEYLKTHRKEYQRVLQQMNPNNNE